MKSDEQVCLELREATRGLLFMSESDYPFEIVRWGGSEEDVSPERLRRVAGQEASSPVVEQPLADFLRVAAGEQEWKDEAQLQLARKYQHLSKVLEENLRDVRVYRVGGVNIAVYVLGQSNEGNWLGISTRVVET